MTSEAASAGREAKSWRDDVWHLTGAAIVSSHSVLLLVCLILLATGLRLFHLGEQSFWYDEAETIGYATNLFPIRDIHPPTYYSLVHLAMQAGTSEFWIRFPSFLMGAASIVVIYAIGRLILTDQVTLVATLLASLSPILIWHSQDARMYSQLLLGCLLTIYFYLQILRRGKALDWIGYLFAALFAAYTQLYALLLIFALNCHVVLFHRRLLWRWIGLQFLFVLGYIPWLIILFNLPPESIGGAKQFSLFHAPYTYFAFINGYSLGPTIPELRDFSLKVLYPYLPLIVPIGLVISALGVAGVRYLWRASHEICGLLVLWAVVPVLIAVFIPLVVRSMTYNVRYVLFSVPACLFILASGVVGLRRYWIGQWLLLIVIAFNSLSLYNDYFEARYAKEDVRGAAQFIETTASPEDHILVITVGHIFNWYFDQRNLVVSNLTPRSADALVGDAAAGTHTVWLVESRPWQTDPSDKIKGLLDQKYSVVKQVDFSGVSVRQYCVSACPSP